MATQVRTCTTLWAASRATDDRRMCKCSHSPPPKGLGCPDSGLSCAQGGPEALHQHPLPSLPAAPGLLLLWVVWTFYEASGLSTGLMSPEIGSHFRVLTMESHSGNSNRTPGIFVRTPGLASVSLETLRGPPQRGMEGGLWLEVPSVGEHQAGASPGPAHQFCSAPEDSTRDPRCLPSCGTITLNPDPPACLVFFHGCFFLGGSWMSALLRDRDHFHV